MLKFDQETFLLLLFKFALSKDWITHCECQMFLPFREFINIVSILFHNFVYIITLLHALMVISFGWHKEYIICLVFFSKFTDVLPPFTCASAIDNLWNNCLGIIILSHFACIRSAIGNISPSKPLKTFCFPTKSLGGLLKVSNFFLFVGFVVS